MPGKSLESISPELKALVHEVSDCWGKTIKREGGVTIFRKIENLRKFLTKFRHENSDITKTKLLRELQKRISKLSVYELEVVTHSFSVLLELTNICENSIRSFKIRKRESPIHDVDLSREVFLVLTAHPTESRAPEMVSILQDIQKIILRSIYEESTRFKEQIMPLLARIWYLHMSRQKAPEVCDEAEYIYSLLDRPEVLTVLLSEKNRNVFVRTWVGGDKDGHGGVNEKVMLQSLQGSRRHLLGILGKLVDELENDLVAFVKLSQGKNHHVAKKSLARVSILRNQMKKMGVICAKDGIRVVRLNQDFQKISRLIPMKLQKTIPAFEKINSLFRLFPRLVVPLELRESSDILRENENLKTKPAIFKMLLVLKELSRGTDACEYAKSFIISMTESLHDLKIADSFSRRALGRKLAIPIVPLFEQNKDLSAGPSIMCEWLRYKKVKSQEIMLGYSDSSKQAGVWPSRLAIHEAMKNFEDLKKHFPKIEFTYFHGSGGSVDRGGGALEDQTAYWPPSAFDRYKVTVQGEAIQRIMATHEIFEKYLSKINDLGARRKQRGFRKISPTLQVLANEISTFYKQSLSDPKFLDMIENASAYRFLNELKIGSRPAKRKRLQGIDSLRAIPWILSWTQTRVLLPVWWGLGTAYTKLSQEQKKDLRKLAAGQDAQFSSYVHQLGFTLAKVEMSIWFMYLDHSELSEQEKFYFKELFNNEYKLALKAFREITRDKKLIWTKQWLMESIRLRSPLIHPLNVAQIHAVEQKNWSLLREASVGIACGMLTTG
jgi:phosphoenolpyruvate carboxylase